MTTLGELSDWLENLKKNTANWQNATLNFTLNNDNFWTPEITLEDSARITLYDEFLTEGIDFELDYDDDVEDDKNDFKEDE